MDIPHHDADLGQFIEVYHFFVTVLRQHPRDVAHYLQPHVVRLPGLLLLDQMSPEPL